MNLPKLLQLPLLMASQNLNCATLLFHITCCYSKTRSSYLPSSAAPASADSARGHLTNVNCPDDSADLFLPFFFCSTCSNFRIKSFEDSCKMWTFQKASKDLVKERWLDNPQKATRITYSQWIFVTSNNHSGELRWLPILEVKADQNHLSMICSALRMPLSSPHTQIPLNSWKLRDCTCLNPDPLIKSSHCYQKQKFSQKYPLEVMSSLKFTAKNSNVSHQRFTADALFNIFSQELKRNS